MSAIPASTEVQHGRRKRRARRACLTCRSRKVRCKKNKADNKCSKQTKTKQVPVEATRDSLSYPYSPTSSDIEVKGEESRVLEPSYPAIDGIISPLTPVSQLEDEYCFGPRYASNHTDQTSSIAWDYSSAASLPSPASSKIWKKQESDPIIWYAGDGMGDDLISSLLALPFDNLRHI
ncbi:hypothetical protein FBULB1_6673 [Fusarium bulbicola]|nr:hypothetical protein FBULB1_6673 [Fusarium bulbicola]